MHPIRSLLSLVLFITPLVSSIFDQIPPFIGNTQNTIELLLSSPCLYPISACNNSAWCCHLLQVNQIIHLLWHNFIDMILSAKLWLGAKLFVFLMSSIISFYFQLLRTISYRLNVNLFIITNMTQAVLCSYFSLFRLTEVTIFFYKYICKHILWIIRSRS